MIRVQKNRSGWMPLRKVVDMALIDDYDDAQASRQRFYHWALRGYRKMNLNILRTVRSVLLNVNTNTGTAKLPDDFMRYVMVGLYDGCGELIPIQLVHHVERDESSPTSACGCTSCNDHSVCDAASYDRTEEIVVIDEVPYTKSVTLRLNKTTGAYVRETIQPVYIASPDGGVTPATVEMQSEIEHLCNLDVLPCGCVQKTDINLDRLRGCGCYNALQFFAVNTYANYRNQCFGDWFTIDEDARLMHLSPGIAQVYLKYQSDMLCVNGEVQVPEIAAEALTAFVLFKRDQRRNIAQVQKDAAWNHYKREYADLKKAVFPLRSHILLNALNQIPR